MTPESIGCARSTELFEAFVDGALPPAESARIADHAAACPACAAQIRLAERIRAQLRSLPRLDAPPQVIATVKAEARAGADSRALGPRWRRPLWAALAAAALLIALAVSFLMPDRHAPTDVELARAANEARYALARVAQLTYKATRDASRELGPRLLVRPAMDGLADSLGLGRDATGSAREDERGAES